jgi:hypothetical protein
MAPNRHWNRSSGEFGAASRSIFKMLRNGVPSSPGDRFKDQLGAIVRLILASLYRVMVCVCTLQETLCWDNFSRRGKVHVCFASACRQQPLSRLHPWILEGGIRKARSSEQSHKNALQATRHDGVAQHLTPLVLRHRRRLMELDILAVRRLHAETHQPFALRHGHAPLAVRPGRMQKNNSTITYRQDPSKPS